LDKDKDSAVSKKDLKLALEKTHGKERSQKIEQLLTRAFDTVDVSKDGFISHSEFLTAAADYEDILTEENLKSTFDAFDKSKTGTITLDDLEQVLNEGHQSKLLGRRDVKNSMAHLDLDGDGEINFQEFRFIMHAGVDEEAW